MTTVATIAAQATADGQEIHRMTNIGGLLHLGYGDYNANTGPMHALVFDPVAQTVADEATLNTEETWSYRQFAGVRYVPYMDPQGGEADAANGQYAYDDGSGWTVAANVTPVPAHVMALLARTGELLLGGAAWQPDGGGATIWRSTDGGATWTTPMAPRPDATGNARFYAFVELGGVVYAVLHDSLGNHEVYEQTGGAFASVGDLSTPVSDLVPFTINGTDFALIIPFGKAQATSAGGSTGVLTAPADVAQHGALLAALPDEVMDACVATDLYVLDPGGDVWRTTVAGVKTRLLRSSVTVRSIAVEGGFIWLGGLGGAIYKTALPA